MSETVKKFSSELTSFLTTLLENKNCASLKDEIENFIYTFESKNNVSILKDNSKIPALLKDNTNKRMRELAGIPHKGNYV